MNKECPVCQGEGQVEVCRRHPSGGCPCAGQVVPCEECEGEGYVPLTDAEIEQLEDTEPGP